jgi:hypothetical protein
LYDPRTQLRASFGEGFVEHYFSALIKRAIARRRRLRRLRNASGHNDEGGNRK